MVRPSFVNVAKLKSLTVVRKDEIRRELKRLMDQLIRES